MPLDPVELSGSCRLYFFHCGSPGGGQDDLSLTGDPDVYIFLVFSEDDGAGLFSPFKGQCHFADVHYSFSITPGIPLSIDNIDEILEVAFGIKEKHLTRLHEKPILG